MESFIREVIASLCLFAANLVICPVTFIIVPSCPSLGAAARGPTRKETGPQAWSPAVPTPVRRGSTTGVLCSQAWFSFNKIHSSNSSSFSPYFDLVFDLLVSPACPSMPQEKREGTDAKTSGDEARISTRARPPQQASKTASFGRILPRKRRLVKHSASCVPHPAASTLLALHYGQRVWSFGNLWTMI